MISAHRVLAACLLLALSASCGDDDSAPGFVATHKRAPAERDASACDAKEDSCKTVDAAASDASEPASDAGTNDAGTDAATADAADAAVDADAPVPDDPYELDPTCDGGQALEVVASPCQFPDEPLTAATLALVDAFPLLTFQAPVFMTYVPDDSDRLVVLERGGVVHVFPNDPNVTESTPLLTLSDVFDEGVETGLLGLTFDPDYTSNGYFYVYYTAGTSIDDFASRIVRYQISSDPNVADPGSATEILREPQPAYYNHKGGMLEFGPDGLLYASLGDGGDRTNGQSTDDLLGAIVRIDVHAGGPDAAYGIPPDNPFASASGGLPELFAWGFRNPWRFSFDRVDERLWVADVGEYDFEEIDLVRSGQNYGWPVREGLHCLPPATDCELDGFASPISEPSFGDSEAIIGGYVYRGAAIPSLYGSYVFGDFSSRALYALHYAEGGGVQSLGVQTDANLASFGVDAAGELYAVAAYPVENVTGKLYKLVEQPGPALLAGFPKKLSATGCFESLDPLRPASGVIPYAVNAPFWADSALARRYVVLPGGTPISVSDDGSLHPPTGAIFLQTFYLDEVQGDRATRRVVETRVLVNQADGLRAYSYRWNDTQTDATLIDDESSRSFELTREGRTLEYTYRFPDTSQCLSCHSDERGRILGFQLRQLDRPFTYPPDCRQQNQIKAFLELGVLGRLVESGDAFARLEDEDAPLEVRARSYLEVQCAWCHAPTSAPSGLMDLRYPLPLESAELCDARPLHGDLGVEHARIIDPGSPDTSLLYLRLADGGDATMPPRPGALVDTRGAAVVREWIDGVTCP
jgi:uncharacterized repeat protein (TIGR03806 family)